MSRARALPLGVALLGLCAGALALADVDSPLRAPLVLAFVLIGPGLAFVPLLGIRDLAAQITLSIGLSLALATFVTLAMVYVTGWSSAGALAVLLIVSASGVALQLSVPSLRWRYAVGRRAVAIAQAGDRALRRTGAPALRWESVEDALAAIDRSIGALQSRVAQLGSGIDDLQHPGGLARAAYAGAGAPAAGAQRGRAAGTRVEQARAAAHELVSTLDQLDGGARGGEELRGAADALRELAGERSAPEDPAARGRRDGA